MNLRALLTLPLIALALAGCGEDNDEGGSSSTTGTGTQAEEQAPATGPAASTVQISETEFKISPAQATAAKGGVVEFEVQNDGQTTHALEVEGGDIEQETEDIAPGESATLKVDLPQGSYELYCPIDGHKDKGMEADLTVGKASGSADDSEENEEQGEGDSGTDDSLEGEAEGKGEGEDSGGATAPGGY